MRRVEAARRPAVAYCRLTARKLIPRVSNSAASDSWREPENTSISGPHCTSLNPVCSSNPSHSAASRAPAIQPVQRSMSSLESCGTGWCTMMSAICAHPPRLQYPPHLAHHADFIVAEVDHSVADRDVGRLGIHGQRLREALAEFDVLQLQRLRPRTRPLEHCRCHVDADHAPGRADLARRQQAVEARPAAEVDDRRARGQVAQRERVAGPGEGVDRRRRQPVHVGLRVAQHRRQRPAVVEVEALFRLLRHLGVLGLDPGSELVGVHAGGGHFLLRHRSLPTSQLNATPRLLSFVRSEPTDECPGSRRSAPQRRRARRGATHTGSLT